MIGGMVNTGERGDVESEAVVTFIVGLNIVLVSSLWEEEGVSSPT
ncbi:unnamed protein product, partial [marine sediment metagenome]